METVVTVSSIECVWTNYSSMLCFLHTIYRFFSNASDKLKASMKKEGGRQPAAV